MIPKNIQTSKRTKQPSTDMSRWTNEQTKVLEFTYITFIDFDIICVVLETGRFIYVTNRVSNLIGQRILVAVIEYQSQAVRRLYFVVYDLV